MQRLKQGMRLAAAALAASLAAACATNGSTGVLQPAATDTLPVSTYAWANDSFVQDPPSGFSAGRLNALEDAITTALAERGYAQAEGSDDPGFIVTVDVAYDTRGAGLDAPMYEFEERREARRNDNVTTVRVVRVDHPATTSVAQTGRNNRAVTAARAGSGGRLYNASAEVGGVIFIGALDGDTADLLWQGQVVKRIKLHDPDSFQREIGDDVARLLEDFPPSARTRP